MGHHSVFGSSLHQVRLFCSRFFWLFCFEMAPTQGSSKRSALSLEKKMEILKAVDKNSRSKSDIAKDFNIPKSTLFTILKNRPSIMKVCTAGVAPDRIRARDSKFPQMEKALVEWLKHVRSKNIPVDGNVLKAKAETFAIRMDIDENFKASDGWLQNFKSRNGLSFKKLCGESAAVNPETVKDWRETRLKRIIADYDPKDIFNADETGLFYQLLPDRSLLFKNESCSSGKKAKQRITALLATNMSGTEKLPIMIVGKSQKPRCFKGVKSLPVIYKANKKAWMVSEFFVEWVRQFDRKMAGHKRNVLLVIDNCTAHPQISGLTNVKIEFFPPNVTSVLQPLDQGIIQAFKKHYRKKLVNRIILNHDNDKQYEVDVLRAIYLADSAWRDVSQTTIVNCFRHAGFKAEEAAPLDSNETSSAPPVVIPDDAEECESLLRRLDEIVAVPDGTRFADYVSVDENLSCAEELSEEGLIQQILHDFEKEKQCESSSDDEDERLEEEQPVISTKQTLEYIQGVCRYLERKPDAQRFLSVMMDVENFVVDTSTSSLKQTDITDYFR